MKRNPVFLFLVQPFICGLLGATLVAGFQAHGATVWAGPTTSYSEPGTDPTQQANQDRLTAHVWLTRAATKGLFNAYSETSYTHNFSPADTEWAYGTLDNYATLAYTNWESWNGANPPSTLNQSAVVHLISDDIYLSITFTSWGTSGAGGFSYTRSTPSASPPPPAVSISKPGNGSIFAAPANVNIAANASVSGGSVTSVAFFTNGVMVGSVQTAPFGITVSNLGAGSYSLTAVATAAGISTTSTAVNVMVVTPVPINLSSPQINNGQFSFTYSANPGLSYVIETSSNLLTWLPVVTNAASSNPAQFSEPLSTNGALFYRVGRLP